MGTLEQYWTGITQWLQIQADVFNRLVAHNGEMGRANEITVSDFLSKLLPPNLGVGTGMLIGIDGGQSRQCDLIVHELHKHPQLFSQTSQLLHPIDIVAVTIEVKTTLDADEVLKIGKNSKSVRDTKASLQSARTPIIAVFAFSTSASPHTTLSWFEALPQDEKPDLVCIVDPGILITLIDGAVIGELVLLHDIDDQGVAKSDTWIPAAGYQSKMLVQGGLHPVAAVRSSAIKGRYVFDSGRALLLFSIHLLSGLAKTGQLESAWWSEYLDDASSETVVISDAS